MLKKQEIIKLSVTIILLSALISLFKSVDLFFYTLASIFLIFLINIIAKKITAYYFDSEIEFRLWKVKRFGFHPITKLKRALEAGLFFPIILTILTLGNLTWMANYVFDVKAKTYRAAKRHGLYSFSEMSEFHIGLIAASGILANLIFAVLGYLIDLPNEMNFVTLSILFASFNMLPISDLDGNKIFFGNVTLWSFLAILSLIGIGYIILVI